MTITDQLAGLLAELRSDVSARGRVDSAESAPFPPPIGDWLGIRDASALRVAMRRHGVDPLGLVDLMIAGEPEASWGQPEVQDAWSSWGKDARVIYRRARADAEELLGGVSEGARTANARWGAWRARRSTEVDDMLVEEFAWSGLVVRLDLPRTPAGVVVFLAADNAPGPMPDGAATFHAREFAGITGIGAAELDALLLVKSTLGGTVSEIFEAR